MTTDRLLVGTRKGLFILRHQGGAWRITDTAFVGDPVPIVLADPRDGALHAALNLGHFGTKYRRSRDGGTTWEDLEPPRYPPKPEGLIDVDPFRKKPVPWNTEQVWELAIGGADDQVLWCGTIPGGLFRSTDGGEHWDLVRSLWDHPDRRKWTGGGFDFPGVHSISVDPRDANHVVVAVSVGGVWTTRDGGETWANTSGGMRAEYMPPEQAHEPTAQDPHRLVRCPGHPDRCWVQHHNGIFVSSDGAASWQEVDPAPQSPFGFAVAVHPTNPDIAWFVPAKKDECRVPVDGRVIVSRTTDGGASFAALRQGLPQEHAYDLVFRHALDVDAASGDRLAMGSSTGALWASEDGGEAWELLSAHLPPIYCVRFG
ncbi:MAG: exo-alpha-sialidase [Planctomycetota bacterium]